MQGIRENNSGIIKELTGFKRDLGRIVRDTNACMCHAKKA